MSRCLAFGLALVVLFRGRHEENLVWFIFTLAVIFGTDCDADCDCDGGMGEVGWGRMDSRPLGAERTSDCASLAL